MSLYELVFIARQEVSPVRAKELAKKIKCKKNEILVSSTGVIGEIFDPLIIINSINKINKISKASLEDGGDGAFYIFLKNNKKIIE